MSLKEMIERFKASRNRPAEIESTLAKELPTIRSLGADLMAISPELPDNTLRMAEKHAMPIDILSDPTSEVLKKYRLWFIVPAEVKALYLEKFGVNLEKYNGAGFFLSGREPSRKGRGSWSRTGSCRSRISSRTSVRKRSKGS